MYQIVPSFAKNCNVLKLLKDKPERFPSLLTTKQGSSLEGYSGRPNLLASTALKNFEEKMFWKDPTTNTCSPSLTKENPILPKLGADALKTLKKLLTNFSMSIPASTNRISKLVNFDF